MGNEMKGEMATCACGARGWIINRSHHLSRSLWLEISHENGPAHFVRRVQLDDGCFRFELLDEGDWAE